MLFTGSSLSTLPLGHSATLEGIDRKHPLRKRLLELGFVPGARVTLVRAAPMGDPLEVIAGGTHFALRRKDLELIYVEPLGAGDAR